MRFLPTRVHGVLDYTVGALLVFLPIVGGFADPPTAAAAVPVALGLAALLYSAVTAYEWGAVGLLSMRTHLLLDLGSGVLLAASPWLFGFSDRVWAPHLAVGLFEVAAALATRTVPAYVAAPPRTAHHRPA